VFCSSHVLYVYIFTYISIHIYVFLYIRRSHFQHSCGTEKVFCSSHVLHVYTFTYFYIHIHVLLYTQKSLPAQMWDGECVLREVMARLSASESKVVAMHVRCVCWQCVAVCCSVLQCVVVSCSVLQCVAVCCSVCSVWQCLLRSVK